MQRSTGAPTYNGSGTPEARREPRAPRDQSRARICNREPALNTPKIARDHPAPSDRNPCPRTPGPSYGSRRDGTRTRRNRPDKCGHESCSETYATHADHPCQQSTGPYRCYSHDAILRKNCLTNAIKRAQARRDVRTRPKGSGRACGTRPAALDDANAAEANPSRTPAATHKAANTRRCRARPDLDPVGISEGSGRCMSCSSTCNGPRAHQLALRHAHQRALKAMSFHP